MCGVCVCVACVCVCVCGWNVSSLVFADSRSKFHFLFTRDIYKGFLLRHYMCFSVLAGRGVSIGDLILENKE